jgi:hypothetical protein
VTLALWLAAATACNDLRDFRGAWTGPRVGGDPTLAVGALGTAAAELEIDALDRHGLRGHLAIAGFVDAPLESVPGAEADVLAGLTFDGAPLKVYLAFAGMQDGEAALSILSLYDDARVELRLLRGGATPLYAIFALRRAMASELGRGDDPSLY